MLSQDRYIKKSSESWLERSMKQYAEQEAMQGRLGVKRTKQQILLDYLKNIGKGVEGLDMPGLEMDPRVSAAGLKDYIPGVDFPQPTTTREEAIVPMKEALQDIFLQTLPGSSVEEREALINAQTPLGSEEIIKQAEDIRKYQEAAKDRTLKKKGQVLTERGLGLRREELTYKKTGGEKADKTITKIESLRKERSALLDKMSPTAISAWYGNTTKSEKGYLKHAFRLNRDIKRLKGTVKGYDDPDQIYADAAKSAKNSGATKEFIMKILMGKELDPREETAKDILKGFLDKQGLRLPILMEYF